MPRTQRVAQYIQRLVYEQLFKPEQRDDWPPEIREPLPESNLRYAAWSPTAFAGYEPFRGPTSNV